MSDERNTAQTLRAYAPQWKQRDGTMIEISDMDDHHVECTYAMLLRRGWIALDRVSEALVSRQPFHASVYIGLLREELRRRGYAWHEIVDIEEVAYSQRRENDRRANGGRA